LPFSGENRATPRPVPTDNDGVTDSPTSFARTPDEQREREDHAAQIAGLVLTAVRYVDIDYRRSEVAPDHRGPREIIDGTEWSDPTWRNDGFDAIDHGVELTCEGGRIFTVTWDSPGFSEGIGLREAPLCGYAVVADADVAVRDVSTGSGWADLIGTPIMDVKLHYYPWNSPYATGFWCPWITISFARGDVHLILGEATGPEEVLGPSSDNIAVVFAPVLLPPWLLALEQ
jgi:hypothetical protein